MANRLLSQFQYTYQIDPVHCWAKITFGATGAPTLTTNPLFSAVTRNSAGDYTFTMRDKFNSLLAIHHVFNTGSGTAPAAPQMWIRTDSASAAAPLLRVVFANAGTATDPASTEVVLMHFMFKNSSI